MGRAWSLLLLVVCACVPGVLDPAGLACDDTHACPGGYDCCAQRCVPRDGGYVWPSAPAGVTWRQVADGFDETRAPMGGTVTVGACNAVSARLEQAGQVQAVGVVTRAAKLPRTREGKLRGTVLIPSPFSMAGNSGFAVLIDATGQRFVISSAVDPAKSLVWYSAPLTLRAAENFGSSGVELLADRAHAFEVRWRQNGTVRLWLDGQQVVDAPLDMGGPYDGGNAVPSELRLGINHYNGAAPTSPGWEVRLTGFELSDDADAPWPD